MEGGVDEGYRESERERKCCIFLFIFKCFGCADRWLVRGVRVSNAREREESKRNTRKEGGEDLGSYQFHCQVLMARPNGSIGIKERDKVSCVEDRGNQ